MIDFMTVATSPHNTWPLHESSQFSSKCCKMSVYDGKDGKRPKEERCPSAKRQVDVRRTTYDLNTVAHQPISMTFLPDIDGNAAAVTEPIVFVHAVVIACIERFVWRAGASNAIIAGGQVDRRGRCCDSIAKDKTHEKS